MDSMRIQHCEMCDTDKPPADFSVLPTICTSCLQEYQYSIQVHLGMVAQDPQFDHTHQFCDTCNDWMSLPHTKHQARKRWTEADAKSAWGPQTYHYPRKNPATFPFRLLTALARPVQLPSLCLRCKGKADFDLHNYHGVPVGQGGILVTDQAAIDRLWHETTIEQMHGIYRIRFTTHFCQPCLKQFWSRGVEPVSRAENARLVEDTFARADELYRRFGVKSCFPRGIDLTRMDDEGNTWFASMPADSTDEQVITYILDQTLQQELRPLPPYGSIARVIAYEFLPGRVSLGLYQEGATSAQFFAMHLSPAMAFEYLEQIEKGERSPSDFPKPWYEVPVKQEKGD
jgi:hypothetical protein